MVQRSDNEPTRVERTVERGICALSEYWHDMMKPLSPLIVSSRYCRADLMHDRALDCDVQLV
jgi:hypothetical protein